MVCKVDQWKVLRESSGRTEPLEYDGTCLMTYVQGVVELWVTEGWVMASVEEFARRFEEHSVCMAF